MQVVKPVGMIRIHKKTEIELWWDNTRTHIIALTSRITEPLTAESGRASHGQIPGGMPAEGEREPSRPAGGAGVLKITTVQVGESPGCR